MVETKTFEREGTPRATVTRDDGGEFLVVIDRITGLSPQRTLSFEESALGILSLNPVTVKAQTAVEAIELAQLAVGEAVDATDRESSPMELLMIRLRTRFAVANALRALKEDV
jgi:hypothetical protein